jgi:hypothetical protein
MYWLVGSAGVGKSAIAQSIAEEVRAKGRLGAAFFFSRPNQRDKPSGVIPTLVHQLAIRFPAHKQLLLDLLDKDPTILEKDLQSQFRLLIVEPFTLLHAQHPFPHSFLIVLDGLDECCDKNAQTTFIRLISECSRIQGRVPLAWLICSRPEWHLKRLFPTRDVRTHCICDELLVHGVEGRDDVYRYLCDEFCEVRRRFSDEVDERWPAEQEIVELADASSGHFGFASTAMNFIKSDHPGDPISQLQVCLNVVRKARISGNINPMDALDLLYHQIFSTVPPIVLPIAMQILSLHLLQPFQSRASSGDFPYNNAFTPFHIFDFANVLVRSRAQFYSSLRELHSVLEVPSIEDADQLPLRLYHASLSDFLMDPGRSFALHERMNEAHHAVAMHLHRWRKLIYLCRCMNTGAITCHATCF